MRTLNILLPILIIGFSCQTSSQNNDAKNDLPVIQTILKANKYAVDSADIAIYNKIITFAKDSSLETKSYSEIEIAVANQLLGTPYVGKTLEKDSIESLVINLRELDCTTFVENVLAISMCIKNKSTSFEEYCEALLKLRYREGKIDQYPSRLHYTTDWLLDNQKKGIIEIVSEMFGSDNFDASVNFMSTHPQFYKQLSNNQFVNQMKEHEIRISASKLKFVQKSKINEVSKFIKDGDMIAISTTIPGLDFSHMALAEWKNGRLYFINASSREKKVVLSDKTLFDYMAGMKNNDGIVVARLK